MLARPLASLTAYDSDCRIICGTHWHPRYEGSIGSQPWDFVEPKDRDGVRNAALLCLIGRKESRCFGSWGVAGRWLVDFYPFDNPRLGDVRMQAIALPVPDAVMGLSGRELAVCRLMLNGANEAAIAEGLDISGRSVQDAKRNAARIVGVATHELPIWVGEMRRFLEPL